MTDLRAEVARAIDAARSEGLRGQADAAIAVVLEEAAKVATSYAEMWPSSTDGREGVMRDIADMADRSVRDTANNVAKAIRQMGSR